MKPFRSCKPPGAAPRRILVVDDHPLLRSGLIQCIGRCPDLVVCAEAGSPAEALAKLEQEQPDLLLTDMAMPGRSGFEFIKDVLALHPRLPILILSMHDEGLYAERVLRAGARGYVMKDAGGERLLAAIREVLAGGVSVSPGMAARLLNSLTGRRARGAGSPIELLSDREFEVLGLIGGGSSTREIAAQLHLSPKTIEAHRTHIRNKLSLRNGTELLRYAIHWVESRTWPADTR